MPIGILYRDELKEYDFGPGHPFRGDRYQLFLAFLREHVAEDDNYRLLAAEPAGDEDLLLICRRDYIGFNEDFYRAANLGAEDLGEFFRYQSGDNLPVGKPGKLEEAARLVIGQAKMACDLVQQGRFSKAVSIGGGLHHAKQSSGEGFCIYNDVAFCGRYLLQEYKLERVLILDTDAHAGNGTAEYFYDDPRVLFIDLHQDPSTIYPGSGFAGETGSGEGSGFTVNVPMPVNAGMEAYRQVFRDIVRPLVREFNPRIIVRNGGSDPHFSDGLTSLGLPLEGFRMIGDEVREMASVCDGKVVDLIASGYNREVLPYAWLALISGLAGFELDLKEAEPLTPRDAEKAASARTEKVIANVKANLKQYWECFR